MSAGRAAWPTTDPGNFPKTMTMAEHFPDTLKVQDGGIVCGTRVFRLLDRYRYRSSLGTVTVPAGFLTDGASIPRPLWSVLEPFGPWFPAAIIHDFLYTPGNRGYTRLQADLIFKEAMFNLYLDWPRREAIYRAVRMFGGRSYRGARS
jgi:Protein of unknown function (DUF1353)